ncbi:acetyl-hydrolase [Magnaporthiopsis poae ATCC 64411]|uniref:Acetyl-hydrolase n=1 Tax=Magnaporthiopsis poae (strain ATCC 64411 / 73-15) TaxID=644358 RepID=A0A0C4EEQ8_MAGP6|nr:acetyl-hydrolase [Magnaporthiopsis poae ATCC 64411]
MAAKLADAGVRVVLEEYEAMPHCFALVFRRLTASERCFDAWARFIKEAVETKGSGPGRLSSFTTIQARTLKEVPLALQRLRPCSEEDMREQLWRRYTHLMTGGGADVASAATAAAPVEIAAKL